MKIDTIEYIKEMNFNNMKQDDIQFCYDSIEDQHIKGNGNLVTLEVNDKIVEVNAKHLLTQLEVKYNVKPKNCSILTLTDIKDMGLKNLEKLDKKNTMDLIKIYSEIHYKRLDVEKHYDFDYDKDLSIKSVITNQMATDLELNAVEIENYDSVIICDMLTLFENKISEMIQNRLQTKEQDKMEIDKEKIKHGNETIDVINKNLDITDKFNAIQQLIALNSYIASELEYEDFNYETIIDYLLIYHLIDITYAQDLRLDLKDDPTKIVEICTELTDNKLIQILSN